MRGWMKSAIVSAGLGLVLAGCGQQPIGSFARANFIADGGQAHHDVRFTQGCTSLAQGEAPRLKAFLEALELRRGDDIVVSMGSTGSDRRDRERRNSILSAIEPGPARVLLSPRPGFARRDPRYDAALVQVIRHDQVAVDCKAGGYNRIDRSLRMPFPVMNCANPSNLAHMAAEKRDLTSPRQLGPARAEPASGAVRRQRAGEVRTVPLDSPAED